MLGERSLRVQLTRAGLAEFQRGRRGFSTHVTCDLQVCIAIVSNVNVVTNAIFVTISQKDCFPPFTLADGSFSCRCNKYKPPPFVIL